MLGEKELVLNVDFLDYTFYFKKVITEEDIKNLLLRAKESGFDRVNWRLSVCGKLAYHTRVGHRFDGEGEKDTPALKYLVETMEVLDPLEVAVKHARELGLRIYAWYTPFDQGPVSFSDGPCGPMTCDFIKQNPQFQMVSKDGKEYFKGVPSFAYSEVQAYHLAIVKELLAYGVDGLYLPLGSHSPRAASENHLDFGYNQPVVDEYKRRYGIDIRKEEFDVFQWGRLRGEYLTEFFRMVRKEARKHGAKVESSGGGLGSYGDFNYQYCWLHFDWETWAKEDLIDILSVFLYGPTVPLHWYWNIMRYYDPSCKVFAQMKKHYHRKLGKAKLYAAVCVWDWQAPEGRTSSTQSKSPDEMKNILETFKQLAFDGVILHEALNLEPEFGNLWETIADSTKATKDLMTNDPPSSGGCRTTGGQAKHPSTNE